MSLREKLQAVQSDAPEELPLSPPPAARAGMAAGEMKMRIHQKMLDRVDLAALDALPTERLKQEVAALVERLIAEEAVVMNEVERRTLIRDVQYEMLGLGPLELLLADPGISDILVNGHRQVFVERGGRLEPVDVKFSDDKHLMRIIDKIVSRVGRRIDESSPMVDARLQDGSRVNAVIPPLALDGPILSIRRFSAVPLAMDDLVNRHKSLTPYMAQMLEGLIRSKVNMLVSGGTGSGKTTLLNILSGCIPHAERVVTIEDAAELQLQQPHVVRLETRPPNIEGKGEVTQRALLINALRMRPDRIIVGEVRGAEAVDMLQAMNTGHEGSLTTVHANSPRDALARVENMIGLAGFSLTTKAIRQQIASAITVIVQVSRLADGRRKVVSIQELTGMESETITMQEIFAYRQSGIDAEGKVSGYFAATGVRPKFMDRLHSFGIALPDAMFDPAQRFM
ncbi:MAG TPA: CpaF family protein [Rhodocyclaceae bacterium]